MSTNAGGGDDVRRSRLDESTTLPIGPPSRSAANIAAHVDSTGRRSKRKFATTTTDLTGAKSSTILSPTSSTAASSVPTSSATTTTGKRNQPKRQQRQRSAAQDLFSPRAMRTTKQPRGGSSRTTAATTTGNNKRKSSDSSAASTTSGTSTASTAKRRTTRREKKKQQQQQDQRNHVTPSPVGTTTPAPSPGPDHSPIKGVKEALRVESEFEGSDGYASADGLNPTGDEEHSNFDGKPIRSKKDKVDKDTTGPPEGVVDLYDLASHHLQARTDPHLHLPSEPYAADTTNSYLAQYGREYYANLTDHAARRHRALIYRFEDVEGGAGPIVTTGSGNDLLPHQAEITVVMRSILVDWLAELKHSFKLADNTLHLSVKLLDRILRHWDFEKKMFQCLGCACMLIASKLEETQPVTIKDLAYMTDKTYSTDQIKEMEAKICDLLQFRLQTPTAYLFIDRLLRASDATAGRTKPSPRHPVQEQMVVYLAELSLMEANFIETPCCKVASAAVYLARATLGIRDAGGKLWNKTLEHYSGYAVRDLEETIQDLHKAQRDSRDSDLQCCIEPYRRTGYCVANKPAIQASDLFDYNLYGGILV